VSVIAGHRDTHFAFLRDLAPGERIHLDAPGRSRVYQVTGSEVADSRRQRLALADDTPSLALVTCFPFDAPTAGGPLRYVVTARAVPPAAPPAPGQARPTE
jgi:sortase A